MLREFALVGTSGIVRFASPGPALFPSDRQDGMAPNEIPLQQLNLGSMRHITLARCEPVHVGQALVGQVGSRGGWLFGSLPAVGGHTLPPFRPSLSVVTSPIILTQPRGSTVGGFSRACHTPSGSRPTASWNQARLSAHGPLEAQLYKPIELPRVRIAKARPADFRPPGAAMFFKPRCRHVLQLSSSADRLRGMAIAFPHSFPKADIDSKGG